MPNSSSWVEININSGQVYCVTGNTFGGKIFLNGGTICIAPGVNISLKQFGSLNGTIINNGTLSLEAWLVGSGTIINNGVMSSVGLSNFTGSIINNGTYTTSNGFEKFNGTITNTGTFSITNYWNAESTSIEITNSGVFNASGNAKVKNTTFTNSGTVNFNSGMAYESGYINNLLGATMNFNMTSGSTSIYAAVDNSGFMNIKNANSSEQAISSTFNNYGVVKFYGETRLGTNCFLTNDNEMDFYGGNLVNYKGTLLANNGVIRVHDGGYLHFNSSNGAIYNNGLMVVSGNFSHNAIDVLFYNNCRIITSQYVNHGGITRNNGLIWATSTANSNDNASIKVTSGTFENGVNGYVRGHSFYNSKYVVGAGRFYFTGNTNMNAGGTMHGTDPVNPIQVFDVTRTGTQIFDQEGSDLASRISNLIRPATMDVLDSSSYDCSSNPPIIAGYPPSTQEINYNSCEVAPLTFDFTNYVSAHPNVDNKVFTVQWNSIKLFEHNNINNTTNNSTNLIIPSKGTFTVNPATGILSFTPDPLFLSGNVEIDYKINNTWSGNPSTHTSPKTKITIHIGNSLTPPPITSGGF